MLAAVRRLTWRQWLGGCLLLAGFGATIALAYVAGASKPPSQSVQVGLAALSILAGTGATITFSGVGRADPTHAQRSAARLFGLASQAANARTAAETAFSGNTTKADLHTTMGMMSVHFSYMEDGLVQAVEDWRVFHPFAVEQAEDIQDRNDGSGDGGNV